METGIQFVRRIVVKIVVIDVVLLTASGLLCLGSGQCSLFNYGSALQIVGVVAAALGALATAGNFAIVGNWKYQFGRSVSVADIPERTQQDVQERGWRESLVVPLAIAGAVALVAGFVIQSVLIK